MLLLLYKSEPIVGRIRPNKKGKGDKLPWMPRTNIRHIYEYLHKLSVKLITSRLNKSYFELDGVSSTILDRLLNTTPGLPGIFITQLMGSCIDWLLDFTEAFDLQVVRKVPQTRPVILEGSRWSSTRKKETGTWQGTTHQYSSFGTQYSWATSFDFFTISKHIMAPYSKHELYTCCNHCLYAWKLNLFV